VRSTELDILQNVEQAEIAVEEAQERIQARAGPWCLGQEKPSAWPGPIRRRRRNDPGADGCPARLTQAQNTEARRWPTIDLAGPADRSVGRR